VNLWNVPLSSLGVGESQRQSSTSGPSDVDCPCADNHPKNVQMLTIAQPMSLMWLTLVSRLALEPAAS
jgi:hypothetical protein